MRALSGRPYTVWSLDRTVPESRASTERGLPQKVKVGPNRAPKTQVGRNRTSNDVDRERFVTGRGATLPELAGPRGTQNCGAGKI